MKKAIWLTGVSAAGKTTVANELKQHIKAPCIILDADILRKNFWPELGMSSADRADNVTRIAKLASFILEQMNSGTVIIACIAPDQSVRKKALSIVETVATVHLVYLHCDLEMRISRDPKGLYKKALSGEIKGLTGYDGVYEIPSNSNLVINTGRTSVQDATQQITRLINE